MVSASLGERGERWRASLSSYGTAQAFFFLADMNGKKGRQTVENIVTLCKQ